MGDLNHQVVLYRGYTPFDTNMEPENTLLKKGEISTTRQFLPENTLLKHGEISTTRQFVNSMAAMTHLKFQTAKTRVAFGKGLALWGAHVGSGI